MGDFGAALTVTPLFLFSLKCFIMQSPTAPETKVKEEELFGSSRHRYHAEIKIQRPIHNPAEFFYFVENPLPPLLSGSPSCKSGNRRALGMYPSILSSLSVTDCELKTTGI
ncbi:hypothetical protein F2P81_023205 [Scophthalmus maximus]|uniref:Uncharacterized protein n=1 Tax=Scophthalmus maximus TaxID=52904 RepID=A0A6A4RQV9_SCOMX|nr:hypothetical protein F2P81_023205 [Scophthalmus maximus]